MLDLHQLLSCVLFCSSLIGVANSNIDSRWIIGILFGAISFLFGVVMKLVIGRIAKLEEIIQNKNKKILLKEKELKKGQEQLKNEQIELAVEKSRHENCRHISQEKKE